MSGKKPSAARYLELTSQIASYVHPDLAATATPASTTAGFMARKSEVELETEEAEAELIPPLVLVLG